jgi:RhtB (resistance to homoserine/threonine) family protein
LSIFEQKSLQGKSQQMEYLPLIGTVTVLNLVAAMSPGPDFIMTVKNSLRYSRRSGIFTGIGIALGLSVHLIYCAAGIGYIISKSIVLFNFIKILGAGYLIYIGLSSILSKSSHLEIKEEQSLTDLTRLGAFKMGFLCNVLNPKATLFFLSLFTFVISNTTPLHIILIISFIIIATALAWFTIVSIFFTQQKVQQLFQKSGNTINRILGGLLVAIGIKIALTFR